MLSLSLSQSRFFCVCFSFFVFGFFFIHHRVFFPLSFVEVSEKCRRRRLPRTVGRYLRKGKGTLYLRRRIKKGKETERQRDRETERQRDRERMER